MILILGSACASAELPEPVGSQAVRPDTVVEPSTSTRLDEPIDLEARWRSPFAVSSVGSATPARDREVVVIGVDTAVVYSVRESERVTLAVRAETAPPTRPAARPVSDDPAADEERRERVGASDLPFPDPGRDRVPPDDEDTDARIYQVRSGDTWLAIAIRYGITSDMLQAANPGVQPNRIRIGQRLVIPEAGSRAATPPAGSNGRQVHRVEGGESLWTIARRYGVSIDGIREANDLDGDRIRPGQVLVIP